VSAESDFLHEPAQGGLVMGERRERPRRTAGTVAGYLSALAIFTSIVGIAWHPLRLILPSLLIALVSSGLARREGRLQLASVLICGVSLFLGLALAVATSHPIW
jgi:hypothetical protein